MDDQTIKRNLEKAIRKLYREDKYLIEKDINERAITHKLAEKLAQESGFPEYHVDCEYNRNKGKPKIIKTYVANVRKKFNTEQSTRTFENLENTFEEYKTYPDIIIHERGTNDNNLLIIEAKKEGNDNLESDIRKLEAFTGKNDTNEYHYQLGVLIVLKKSVADTINSLKYWKNGGELKNDNQN